MQGRIAEDRAPGSETFMQPTEPPVGIDGSSVFGSPGGQARLSFAVGLSHAQRSSMVEPSFNWDVYSKSVLTSSTEEGRGTATP